MIQRIEQYTGLLTGRPVVKGTRVPVALILNLLAHGYTAERVIEAYPVLAKEDVAAAIDYAARVVGEEKTLPAKRIAYAR